MTLKRLSLVAVASVALASAAFAGSNNGNAGKWAVGLGFANPFGGGVNSLAYVTYMNDSYIVQGGFGYGSNSISNAVVDNSSDPLAVNHAFEVNLSFGLRNMMNNQVSLDYGATTNYAFASFEKSDTNAKNPFSMGAFVGLDYMPVQNVMMSARIQPFTYIKYADQSKSTRLFANGSLSVSYVF